MDERTNPSDQPATPDQDSWEQPLPLDPNTDLPADDPVQDASEDSFPASDPPSFTGTTTE